MAVSLRAELLKLGMQAMEQSGNIIKDKIDDMQNVQSGQTMDPSKSLEIQFLVGEYNTLTQTVTGIEKMMKDSIMAAARNTT